MDPDPIDGDQVYAAERLLQTRTRKGQQEFLVKWKGWNSKHNTWEPRANILDDRLIQEFEQRVGSRAPKRRAVGAPPSSSGGKEATTQASAVEFGPPQPKRGRRAVKSPDRAKKDNVSDVTSPSTSIGTRRSSRRSSIAKESRAGSVVEKTKTVEAASNEAKAPSKPSPVKEQVEEDKKLGPSTDTEQELSTEDEEKSVVEEKKTTLSQDESKSTVVVGPVVEQPLEIYVQRTVKTEKHECATVQQTTPVTDSTNLEAPIENGQSQKAEISTNEDIVSEDAFIITNESDPATTHKIQVFTLSDNGISSEQKQKGAPSGSKSTMPEKSVVNEEVKAEEVTVVKDDQPKSGSVVDTVGSSDEGNAQATSNGQNKKTAETVIATVTLDDD